MLELSQHELYFLPPGTPATAPATRVEVEVDGKGRVFSARLILLKQNANQLNFYSIFYRDENVQDSGIFASGACLSAEAIRQSNLSEDDIIRKKAHYPFAERYWYSPDGDYAIRFNVYSSAIGWGCHRNRAEEQIIQSLQLPNKEKLLSYSQTEFLKLCVEFHSSNSPELRFILKWRKLTTAQRNEIAFGCERGNWDELRHLFSLVQIIIVHHFNAFVGSANACVWRFDYARSATMGTKSECLIAVPWIELWRETLCEIFLPSFWIEEEYNCIYKWRRASAHKERCEIYCSVPTHHELLEAQMQLREFLRPHLSDDSIDALMRPTPNEVA